MNKNKFFGDSEEIIIIDNKKVESKDEESDEVGD